MLLDLFLLEEFSDFGDSASYLVHLFVACLQVVLELDDLDEGLLETLVRVLDLVL